MAALQSALSCAFFYSTGQMQPVLSPYLQLVKHAAWRMSANCILHLLYHALCTALPVQPGWLQRPQPECSQRESE